MAKAVELRCAGLCPSQQCLLSLGTPINHKLSRGMKLTESLEFDGLSVFLLYLDIYMGK